MKRSDNIGWKLIKEAKPIAHWLLLAAVIDVLSVLCAVAAPEILGELVDKLCSFTGVPLGRCLVPGLLRLTVVYVGSSLFSYMNMYLMNTVVTRHFTRGLRTKISEKIRRLPVSYVDQTPVGDILNRLIDDVGDVGGYVHQIFDVMVKGVLQILLIAIAMYRENWILASFVILLTPASMWLSGKIASACEAHYDAMFTTSGKVTELVEEAFSNYPNTKAYNLEAYTAQKHAAINDELRKHTAKANFTGSIVQPLIRFANALAYILINLAGGLLVIRQGVGVGAVVTIVLYARQFASPLEQISYGFAGMNRVKASARRIYSILDREEEENPAAVMDTVPQGYVEMRNVCFSYREDAPLIEDLSLKVQPGQKIAIVGPTGGGKTTIVNLLMRFYDIRGGAILLDGQDTSLVSRETVREKFGMVLQDTWLFRGTIAQNIAYGKPDATLDEIREAAKQAYCDHFICTMPDGYDTVIGEDTTNLSGGQKQLLTIARAMLANKPLLILDEATSNVDTRTEMLIQEAMDRLMTGKTCFVIAHRLSTIVDADHILVIDHGKVVEQGKHRELLEKRGFYHTLYTSQYAL